MNYEDLISDDIFPVGEITDRELWESIRKNNILFEKFMTSEGKRKQIARAIDMLITQPFAFIGAFFGASHIIYEMSKRISSSTFIEASNN